MMGTHREEKCKAASDITTRTTTLVVNGPIKLHLINVKE